MRLSEVDAGAAPDAGAPSGTDAPPHLRLSQVGQPPSSAPGGPVGAFFRSMATGLGGVWKGAEGVGVKALSGLMGPSASAYYPQRHAAEMERRQQSIQQDPSVQAYPRISGAGRFAGEVLGTAPIGVIPGMGQAPLLARGGAAALQGGLGAGILSGGDPKAAGFGAAAGLVPGVGGALIGPRIGPAFEAIKQQFPHLADMASGKFGRTAENFQTAAANFALHPISEQLGRGIKAGKQLLDEVGDKVSTAYDRALRGVTFQAHRPDDYTGVTFMSGLADLRAKVPAAHERDFDKLIDQQITGKFDKNGNMTGAQWKDADSTIGKKAANYLKGNNTADQREFAGVLRELQEEFRDTLHAQNPTRRSELQAVDRAWGRYVQMQQASGRKYQDDFFSPDDLMATVRNQTGKQRFAQSENDMKAFGRAGQDLIAGRPTNWPRMARDLTIGGAIGGSLGAGIGHSVAGVPGGIIGGGVGLAAGTAAGEVARRARQLPAARATGRVIERAGGPTAGAAAGQYDTYVSGLGP